MDREGLMSQKIFFTADLHFGHKNIITMTKRKFGSIEEHDDFIINNINSVVGVGDYLYILGDLGFHKNFMELLGHLSRINCKNIHIIKGNHDNLNDLIQLKRDHVIADVKEMKTVQKGRYHIFCCHYPMREWPGFYRGYYHAHGHCHATLKPYEKSMDVGVDNTDFIPIEFDDLIERIDSAHKVTTNPIAKSNKELFELNNSTFIEFCKKDKVIQNRILEILRDT